MSSGFQRDAAGLVLHVTAESAAWRDELRCIPCIAAAPPSPVHASMLLMSFCGTPRGHIAGRSVRFFSVRIVVKKENTSQWETINSAQKGLNTEIMSFL